MHRYFHHLHTLSDRPESIIYLCITFENLLKQSDANLYFHLHHTLDIEPLSIAHRWIIYGFVGILDPDQLLLLWDRMIGYQSCLIFSVLAAALFVFRKDALLMAHSEKEVIVGFSLN